jgi:hypothetical protein
MNYTKHMNTNLQWVFRLLLLAIILLTQGCGGGTTACSAGLGILISASACESNIAPIANAGVIQNVSAGSLVTLDGSKSRDSNNQSLTYNWKLISPAGSKAQLSEINSPNPNFTADFPGLYEASLVVNDGKFNSDVAKVSIYSSITNSAPVANAGENQNVVVGSLVRLDGTSSNDVNEDQLSFRWSLLSKPIGSSTQLINSTSPIPKLTPDLTGTYIVDLIVNDGKIDSQRSAVTVTATLGNAQPIAVPNLNQNVVVGSDVILDGTSSYDSNNDFLTYSWVLISKPLNSEAKLNKPNGSKADFVADKAGSYVATLVVNDGNVNSQVVATTVTAAAKNSAPVAVVGPDQIASIGRAVTLDGSLSSDANGDTLNYKWKLLYKPSGSSASLSTAVTSKPIITPDQPGVYVASLIVNDGEFDSSVVSTTVTADYNLAPTANAGPSQAVIVGGTVTLNGTLSNDINGDTLTYTWTLTVPVGSSSSLLLANTSSPKLTPDVAGIYTASLIVSDGNLSSSASTVTITAVAK